MKNSLVSLAALALSFLTASACLTGCLEQAPPATNGVDGKDGANGLDGKNGANGKDGKDACTPPDPTFWLVLRDFEEAERYYGSCTAGADAQYAICLAGSKPDDFYCKEAGSCQAYCQQNYHSSYDNCYKYTAWRANKTTVRLCGAKVWTYTPPTDTGVPYGTLGGVTTEDTDGDGLSNFEEYQLLLNPCSKTSYGSCTLDAELDGDFDGEPNGTDALPYCNLQDPENVSDCILESRFIFPIKAFRFLNYDPPAGESGTAWMTRATLEPRSCGFSLF